MADDDPKNGKPKPYDVGYAKPPKRTQFKKGESGNPAGGWPQRRAKAQPESRNDIIERVLRETVSIGVGEVKPKLKWTTKKKIMTVYEVIVRRFIAEASAGDAPALARLQSLMKDARNERGQETGRGNGGVLVVYPTMEEDEWEKATEGQLQTINPLAGLPGGDEFYERHMAAAKRKRSGPL